MRVATLILAGLMWLALPASAHTDAELEAFFASIEERRAVMAQLAPARIDTDALLAEIVASMRERHPCSRAAGTWTEACERPDPVAQPASETATVRASEETPDEAPAVDRGIGAGVEQWRGLVAAHFPAGEVGHALCIMSHESGGNPNALNPRSGAAGLFQIMPFWWDAYGGDRFHPETNVKVARVVWDQQGWGGWSPWNRGLCRN